MNAAAYADDFKDPLNGMEYDQELHSIETSTYPRFLLTLSTGCLMKPDMKNHLQSPRRPSKRLGKGPSVVAFDMGQNFGFWAARSSGRRVGGRRAYDDSVSVSWSAP